MRFRSREDDELIAVRLTSGQDILIGTSHASLIRFPESTLRPLGRTATGVKKVLHFVKVTKL
ncbi:DNA gyrase C-terminal beta-propeller domain-containing protein [Staphylococcus aureus]